MEFFAVLVSELKIKILLDLHNEYTSFSHFNFGARSTTFRNLKELRFNLLKIDQECITCINKYPDN